MTAPAAGATTAEADATTAEAGTTAAEATTPILVARNLVAGYGQSRVLHGLDFEVRQREVVVILGANGAGKTTTLRAISGMIASKGTIELDGRSIGRKPAEELLRMGVAHVPQGRGTMSGLSVLDNLLAGAITRKDRSGVASDIDRWFTVFPRLGERKSQRAGSLSGGEQQMLAVARAFMSRPRLLLLDEPSLGLAPLVIAELFQQMTTINRELGAAMLLVEQNAELALDLAQRAYVLEAGRVAAAGPAAELKGNESVRRAYLGY